MQHRSRPALHFKVVIENKHLDVASDSPLVSYRVRPEWDGGLLRSPIIRTKEAEGPKLGALMFVGRHPVAAPNVNKATDPGQPRPIIRIRPRYEPATGRDQSLLISLTNVVRVTTLSVRMDNIRRNWLQWWVMTGLVEWPNTDLLVCSLGSDV